MIERQRILLSFLERHGGPPSRTHVMKWLFLLRHEVPAAIATSFYEFVPYRYGPFSFQAYRELDALESSGMLEFGTLRIPTKSKEKVKNETRRLPGRASQGIDIVLRKYEGLSLMRLLDDVYTRYPWYASRSELRPEKKTAKRAQLAIYTVGYEARTIDGLLDHLLRSGIQQLIDVRKNAISRKYGFSGKSLTRLCGNVGIKYVHLPELGIPSSLRAGLSSDAAYQKLFDHYERKLLSRADTGLARATELCLQKPSVLMCFEASSFECHRGRLAPRVAKQAKLQVCHL